MKINNRAKETSNMKVNIWSIYLTQQFLMYYILAINDRMLEAFSIFVML